MIGLYIDNKSFPLRYWTVDQNKAVLIGESSNGYTTQVFEIHKDAALNLAISSGLTENQYGPEQYITKEEAGRSERLIERLDKQANV